MTPIHPIQKTQPQHPVTPIQYTPSHYPLLCQWWTAHNWPQVPAQFLPATGFLISTSPTDHCSLHTDHLKAAGFLYHDPTASLAGIEWIVTNPSNTARQSYIAIDQLVTHIRAHAQGLGITALWTSCAQPSLARLLEATGFIPSDKNMHHLILPL